MCTVVCVCVIACVCVCVHVVAWCVRCLGFTDVPIHFLGLFVAYTYIPAQGNVCFGYFVIRASIILERLLAVLFLLQFEKYALFESARCCLCVWVERVWLVRACWCAWARRRVHVCGRLCGWVFVCGRVGMCGSVGMCVRVCGCV